MVTTQSPFIDLDTKFKDNNFIPIIISWSGATTFSGFCTLRGPTLKRESFGLEHKHML